MIELDNSIKYDPDEENKGPDGKPKRQGSQKRLSKKEIDQKIQAKKKQLMSKAEVALRGDMRKELSKIYFEIRK